MIRECVLSIRPEGTTENSPPVLLAGYVAEFEPRAVGTTETITTDFKRPYGTPV
jgi:hypothetical protein